VLTDGRGIPLGVAIDGANRPDYQMMEATVRAIPIPRPAPTPEQPQHLCLDNGYDYEAVRTVAVEWGYTLHIRPRGEEAKARAAGKKARRWVVERTHSWLHRFRRILIRWDKKPGNYLAFLHLACALITFRAADWEPELSG
jgi:putative transposase